MSNGNDFYYGPGEDSTPGYYGGDTGLGDTSIQFSPLSFLGNPSFSPAPLAPNPQAGPSPNARGALNLLALLLGGGALAGAGQNLFGRPPTTTATPQLSPQQLQSFGGAQGTYNQLLALLQNPQISPGMSQLVEQAFQPQLGSLFSQATEAGRRRGFYDAPGTSPPGGAIFGPGLADLQGQMAQAKLNLYQNQIGNLLRTAQGQGGLATGLPAGQRTQTPRPSILNTIGGVTPILSDIGKILGIANPAGSQGSGIGSFLSGLNPFSLLG